MHVANQLDNGFDPCYPFTQCPIVYEFHRCLWHRCLCCFPLHHDRSLICHNDRALQELFKSTLTKQETLRQRGYDVKMQWECAWDQEVKTKPDLQQFLDRLEIVDLLQFRDAFFGRCTNAVKLPHATDVHQGEKVKYKDVTLLYSWASKKGKYPVGHPKVLVNPKDQDNHHYFGIAKVDILPPHKLYHPVLPFRHKGNLTFPLCQVRMEEEM